MGCSPQASGSRSSREHCNQARAQASSNPSSAVCRMTRRAAWSNPSTGFARFPAPRTFPILARNEHCFDSTGTTHCKSDKWVALQEEPREVSQCHLTFSPGTDTLGPMTSISIKELHARTGAHVRRAAKSPVRVTDRGRLVAVLTSPDALPPRKRNRVILPEYAALLAKSTTRAVLDDLDAVRGSR